MKKPEGPATHTFEMRRAGKRFVTDAWVLEHSGKAVMIAHHFWHRRGDTLTEGQGWHVRWIVSSEQLSRLKKKEEGATIMSRHYWRHTSSGDTYAVETGPTGDVVTDACGPLHDEEVTLANLLAWNFNGEPNLAKWLDDNSESFSLVEPPYKGDELTKQTGKE